MKPLKDLYYGLDFYERLAHELHRIYPSLKPKAFLDDAVNGLEQRELKQRIDHTAIVCQHHLPTDYGQALSVLYSWSEGQENNFSHIFVPSFVARYGQHDYTRSIQALKDLTQYSSSELAIRSYLTQDFTRTLKHMQHWTGDDNHHVRRLASEGCRPRLPWASRVPQLMTEPGVTWPIIESLKDDNELYVRKSVANHINDLSKDHPDWLVQQLSQWSPLSDQQTWIMRHGCRSLIKAGNSPALSLLGFNPQAKIDVTQFQVHTPELQLGQTLSFSFELSNPNTQPQKLAIDYCIHYRKKTGKLAPKVFKLKEINLAPNDRKHINKQQLIKNFSTRIHYAGAHEIELLVNGISQAKGYFDLKIGE